jgi:hypothetical protein
MSERAALYRCPMVGIPPGGRAWAGFSLSAWSILRRDLGCAEPIVPPARRACCRPSPGLPWCAASRRLCWLRAADRAGRHRTAACWAHARRKFYDLHEATGPPITAEALRRIAELYAIERSIQGRTADARRHVRNTSARPLIEMMKPSLEMELGRAPPAGSLAEAIRYARSPAGQPSPDSSMMGVSNSTTSRSNARCCRFRQMGEAPASVISRAPAEDAYPASDLPPVEADPSSRERRLRDGKAQRLLQF